jgi:predicted nuclease with TOPRIM domain
VTEYKDFIQHYAHCKDDFKKIVKAKKQLVHELTKTLNKMEKLTPQEIGKLGINSKFKKHLWQLHKSTDVDLFIESLDINPKNEKFSDLQTADLYYNLIYREMIKHKSV